MSVTDRELKALRKAQEAWMPNTVLIQRHKFVGDSQFVPQNVAVDVKCRITPGLGRWTVVADRFQGITPFTITMPWGTDVMDGDQIIDAYGRVFQVRDVSSPKDLATALRLLAGMVTDG